KYQIKCDTSLYPLPAGSCSSLGGSGGSCTDDGGTYYEACKCPLNYEWSAAARKCVCLADFKYTCAGTGYAGGSGESCDNKYQQCSCADGYYWDAAAGECLKSCANECTLSSCASPYTCRYEDCSGKYCKTGCVSGYDWNEAAQTCTSQCAASYKYDESNCPSASYYHCDTSTCGGKYKDCKPVLYSDDAEIFTVDGFTFAKTADLCPRKEFAQNGWNNLSKTYGTIVNGDYKYNHLYECKDQNVDDACYNLFEQVRDAAANSTVNVTQDMFCGNLTLLKGVGKNNVTINGNGHTLTFEKLDGRDFYSAVNVNNLNIISKDRLTSENKVFFDACSGDAFHVVFSSEADIQDVTVTAYYLGRVKASGTVTYIKSSGYSGGRVNRYEITAQPASAVNVKNADYGKVTLMDNAVLSIKSGRDIPVHINGENTAVNLCDYNGDKLNMSWEGYVCKNVTVNSNKEIDVTWALSSNNEKCLSYVTVNVDSSLCGKMNF
ncbi:MAG: hypothetical protein Q4F75_08375, partial [Pseudomonadota bacterium]|nr:hypothetical protein [Pseudomonadota bacterium]